MFCFGGVGGGWGITEGVYYCGGLTNPMSMSLGLSISDVRFSLKFVGLHKAN